MPLSEHTPETTSGLVDQMQSILDAERSALNEHRLADLDELQKEKAECVQKLSLLQPEHISNSVKSQLARCERKNLENGALIQLLQHHVAGSLAVLTGANGDQQTYDRSGRQQLPTGRSGFATSA